MLRRFLITAFLTLTLSFSVLAQNTNVSATVTDAGGQTWNNGTYTFNFQPAPRFNGTYRQNGVPFTPVSISGTLSAVGAFTSIPVPDNAQITPSGTQWTVTVCPQGTGGCFNSLPITITGASQTITSSLIPPAILVSCGFGVSAYLDSEVNCGIGGTYYNSVSSSIRACQATSGNICTTWASAAAGGTAGSLAGPGSFVGTFTGGPTFSISLISISGSTVTATTTVPCPVVSGQSVRVAATGFNGDYAAATACVGSSFTFLSSRQGIASASSGTVTLGPLLNMVGQWTGLIKTGTGVRSFVVNPQNLENGCGSLVAPFLVDTGINQNGVPCTSTFLYYGTPVTGNGFGSGAHRSDTVVSLGYDVRSPITEFHNMAANGTNSYGFGGENSTNAVGLVGVVAGAGQAGMDTSDFVVQSSFTGLGDHLVQANQNLSFTSRDPGWVRAYTKDYSPVNTIVAPAFGGVHNVTSYLLVDSSQTGLGALVAEGIAGGINANHASWRSASNFSPDAGYWSSSASTAMFRASCAPLYSTNGGNTPNYGADCPPFSMLHEETAVTNGASLSEGFVSTNSVARTTCTPTASPNGLIEVDFVVTVTCGAPVTINAADPINIGGAGLSGYNGNFRALTASGGGTTFTYYNAKNGPGATNCTVSSLSEVTLTVSVVFAAPCNVGVGQIFNMQNDPKLDPRTTGCAFTSPVSCNQYNGFFTVATITDSTHITYTHTVSGLPTNTSPLSSTISSISQAPNTTLATATFSAACGFAIGQTLVVTGVTNASYNTTGAYVEVGCGGGNTASYRTASSGLGASSGGTATTTTNFESSLNPSGGGTVTVGTQQLANIQYDASKNLNFRFCDLSGGGTFPCTPVTFATVDPTNQRFLLASATPQVTLSGSSSSNRVFADATGLGFSSDTSGKAIRFLTNPGALQESLRIDQNGSILLAGPKLLISQTAPTIAGAGCGGTVAAITAPNGTASFEVFTGTAPTTACTITMPAATTSWTCDANTVSATTTTNFIVKQTGAISTTSVILTLFSDVAAATNYAASDTLRVKCMAN
jgi:hypothetical protein